MSAGRRRRRAAVDPVEHGIDPDDYAFRRDLGRWRPRVGDDGMVDLYHRTSPSRADSIVAGGFDPSMGGSHPNETVFFSTSPDGAQGGHYGDAVVHVRVPAGDADFDTVWGEDSEEAWATVFPPDLRGLPVRRLASPWHSKAGDPSWPIPTGDLLRYRQFDPGVETPRDYHDSLYREEWSARTPSSPPVSGWGRRPSSDGFDTAGDEGSTEEELVEAFESGADLPPVEIVTNGKGAILSDGNHRVEVADTLSVPALDSHIWFDPQGDDDLYPAPLDMGSELGRRVDEVMQRYPFAPVDSKRRPDGSLPGRFVYRRRGDGRWERGTADDPVPHIVGDEDYLAQMRALPDWAPGTFDDGVGNYWDVDFGDGPKPVHQRRLHARTAMPAVDAYDPDRTPAAAGDPPVYPGPWYHGTDADLEGEAVLRPAGGSGAGHPLAPGAENRRDWVWLTDNPWHAHAYGANVYEVRPGVEGPWPWNGDRGAGRFVSPSATVVRRLDREEWAYAKKYHGNGIHSPASEFYQRHAAAGDPIYRGLARVRPGDPAEWASMLDSDPAGAAEWLLERAAGGGGDESTGGLGRHWSDDEAVARRFAQDNHPGVVLRGRRPAAGEDPAFTNSGYEHTPLPGERLVSLLPGTDVDVTGLSAWLPYPEARWVDVDLPEPRRLRAARGDAYDLDMQPKDGPDQTPPGPGPWFHGSPRKLRPGDIVDAVHDSPSGRRPYKGPTSPRDNWVWMSPSAEISRGYGRYLYEVEPLDEGPWAYNESWIDGYVSPRARVVRVVPGKGRGSRPRDGIASGATNLYYDHAQRKPYEAARGDAYDAGRLKDLGGKPDQAPVLPGPWFHGSPAELQVGDLLDPAAPGNYEYEGERAPRDNWVFMDRDPRRARMWAGEARFQRRMHPESPLWVYKVEPMEEGPYPWNEYPDMGSVSPRARVVERRPAGELGDWEDIRPRRRRRRPGEPSLMERLEQAKAQAQSREAGFYADERRREYDERERAAADAGWAYDLDEPRDIAYKPVDWRRDPAPPPGDKWYHVSLGDLEPGTVLKPRGGPSAWGGRFQDWPRGRWTWMDTADKAEWWDETGEGYVYEVAPSEPPRPWNNTGADGWVSPEARVVRKVRGPRYRTAGWSGDDAGRKVWRGVHLDPAMTDDEVAAALDADAGGWWTDFRDAAYSYGNTVVEGVHPGDAHVAEGHGGESGGWEYRFGPGTELEVRGVHRTRPHRDVPWQPRKLRVAGGELHGVPGTVYRGFNSQSGNPDDLVLDAPGEWWTEDINVAREYASHSEWDGPGHPVVLGADWDGSGSIPIGEDEEGYRLAPGTALDLHYVELNGVQVPAERRRVTAGDDWSMPRAGEGFNGWRNRLWTGLDLGRGRRFDGNAPGSHYRAMSDAEYRAGVEAGEFRPLIGDHLFVTDDPDRLAGGAYGAKGGGHIVEFAPQPTSAVPSTYGGFDELGVGSIPGSAVRRVWSWDGSDHVPGGQARQAALTEDLAAKLQDEFDAWWAANGDDVPPYRLEDESRGPIGSWPYVEEFLRSEYPAAHRGLELGWEEAGALLDHPDRPLPYVSRPGGAGVAPYATGTAAVDEHGYDPAEIAAGMVLLHNRSMPSRAPIAGPEDEARLRDIAVKRHRMQGRRRVAISDLDAYDEWYDHEGPQETAPEHPGPWYHYSPAELPPGTELVPGGGPSPWGDLYAGNDEMGDSEARRAYVWLSPDVSSAVGWAGETPGGGGGFIYRVEPSGDVYPWNDSGAEGWVADSATVVEALPRPWREAQAIEGPPGWANLDPVWVPRRPRGRR